MQSLTVATPLGPLTIVGSGTAIRAILWQGDLGARVRITEPLEPGRGPLLDEAARQLDEYFAGSRTRFTVPLDPQGTPFQAKVWKELTAIPYGTAVSYREVATAIGRRDAVRAVAAANARNPISIIIPCHRVIGSDGRLTGYAGGLAAKEWLLAHEAGLRPGS